MDVLRQGGTRHSEMDRLKMSENTGDSWVAQCFSVAGETPSGPGAFLDFSQVKTLVTSLFEKVTLVVNNLANKLN